MSKKVKLESSEEYVLKLFQNKFGILLTKIDVNDGKDGKNPDFAYFANDKIIFVCEVKEFKTINPSKEAGWETKIDPNDPDNPVGYSRNSIAPNKISRDIHKAFKQFEDYPQPKILVFLNHYIGLDIRDLAETYRGFSGYKIGNRIVVDRFYRRASNGDIKEEKSRIDLYIWIDASDKSDSLEGDNICKVPITDAGRRISQEYFSV